MQMGLDRGKAAQSRKTASRNIAITYYISIL